MITSPDNERVKYVRSLYTKKKRYEGRAFVVEGVRLLEEAIEAGTNFEIVLYHSGMLSRTPRGLDLLGKVGSAAVPVTERVLKSVSDTVAPQGIVAVVPFPEEPARVEGALALVVDRVQDPGNLGTILRTAAAAAVKAVITTRDTVDPFSPKAVRAGMGAHFQLGLFVDRDWSEIERLVAGRTVFLASAGLGKTYYQLDWTLPSALIIGSEASGISEGAKQVATTAVNVPMVPGAESLNAAVAAGILIFEAFRQQSK